MKFRLILLIILITSTGIHSELPSNQVLTNSLFNSRKSAPNMQPAIIHYEQQRRSEEKLKKLHDRFHKKPNVLIFIVDDMGWGDSGAYGGGQAVGAPTPNIDRLAQNGLRLTSTYSQPTCSPSRATLMTGRLPIRHGLYIPLYNKGGIAGEITAAKILNDSGYHTGLVGKWHLGEGPDSQPQYNGYDEFYGFLGVSNMYSDWRDKHINPEVVLDPQRYNMIKNAPFNKNLVMAQKGKELKNIKELTIPVLANIDQDFADYSVDFIKRQAQSHKPFYLIHSFSKVHFNNYPADGYAGKSPAKYPYKDAIVEVDDIVGRIMQTLKDTGQDENTLVFFTSDNGVEEDTWPDAGYAPWRGSKGTTWEGGVRVPGIAYWPGVIKPRVSDGLLDFADLFTTSLNLAGVKNKIPKDRYIDGIDQTSFLLDDDGKSNREAIYYWLNDALAAVRWDEYKWHRIATNIADGRYDAVGSMNLGVDEKPNKAFVFNLYTDPRERKPQVINKVWVGPIFQKLISDHLETVRKFPPKEAVVELK